MFTGLIECVGTVTSIVDKGDARDLTVAIDDSAYLRDAQLGESICVAGTCLTVVELAPGAFAAQAVEETLRRTTIGELSVGRPVNIERAMKASSRFGGHIVQGHVDGVGAITGVAPEGEGWMARFAAPPELLRYIVAKGSICIDGISLTVAELTEDGFSVALIPHTRQVTTAGRWQAGDRVNLEVDVIAKYVERLTLFAARPVAASPGFGPPGAVALANGSN